MISLVHHLHMKTLLFLLLFSPFLMYAQQLVSSTARIAIALNTAELQSFSKKNDSVLVYEDEEGKVFYKTAALKQLLKTYPVLGNTTSIYPPDKAYAIVEKQASLKAGKNHDFGCEVCRDDFYELYAYFLKQHNGTKKYQLKRDTLLKLFRNINFIAGKLAQGGTYFGHQYRRIAGYAEYAVYVETTHQFYHNKANTPAYQVKQKQLYISSLKRLINDELTANNDYSEKDKLLVKKQLFETVNQIDRLITNYFYLKATQQFQYANY